MEPILNDRLKEALSREGQVRHWAVLEETRTVTSTICKLRVSFEDAEKVFYLKKYESPAESPAVLEAGRNEFETLSKLYPRFSGRKDFRVIRPVTFIPEDRILVTEAFEGRGLNDLILGGLRAWFSDADLNRLKENLRSAGRWLAFFQSEATENHSVILDGGAFLKQAEDMLRVLRRLGLETPVCSAAIKRVGEGLAHVKGEKIRRVGCHNDFTPQNILVGKDIIAVTDFARFSSDSNYEDPALFIVALEGYKSIVGVPESRVEGLKAAFLEGYGAGGVSRSLLHLYILKNVIKVLTWIGPEFSGDAGFLSGLVRKSRKKRRLRVYFHYLDRLNCLPSVI
jgi:hypothetical protein